ncbi:hypothetical protein DSM25559_0659 [Agrobacterium rosae]|uniref:Uncharacterized protein n=1 Tax=Agrobacterium rosae TaxID=1972867 RepID=A0A1R3TAD6_9HYPH|nr:hypothetical protein DSM25559_0659 [Agrobacterium rosae]
MIYTKVKRQMMEWIIAKKYSKFHRPNILLFNF